MRGVKGRRLNRWRSERCERTFAHVCETGGGRRSWLRGQKNVSKTHTLKCAAYNLGLLLRKVWGLRKPRSGAALFFALLALLHITAVVVSRAIKRLLATFASQSPPSLPLAHDLTVRPFPRRILENHPS